VAFRESAVAAWARARTLRGFLAGLAIGASFWIPVFAADAFEAGGSAQPRLYAALALFLTGLLLRVDAAPNFGIPGRRWSIWDRLRSSSGASACLACRGR
jgi:hypothetical protein